MGSKYVIGYNPFQDFLMQSIIYGADLSNKRIKTDIHAAFAFILQNVLDNQNDVVYLDFDIVGDKNNIKVVGKNAVSAVWLSGVFPDNIDLMLKKNVFRIGNRIYKYNKKTKELTYKVDEDNKK
jgi:hypothetical protein